MTAHTTHHDDCGCKSARYEKRIAELEAEMVMRKQQTYSEGDVARTCAAYEKRIAELETNAPACACGYDNPTDVCVVHTSVHTALLKRIATLEAALKSIDAYYLANNGVPCDKPDECDEPEFCNAWNVARAALAGEPEVLTKWLERAALMGLCHGDENHADAPLAVEGMWAPNAKDIAKRVMEGE